MNRPLIEFRHVGKVFRPQGLMRVQASDVAALSNVSFAVDFISALYLFSSVNTLFMDATFHGIYLGWTMAIAVVVTSVSINNSMAGLIYFSASFLFLLFLVYREGVTRYYYGVLVSAVFTSGAIVCKYYQDKDTQIDQLILHGLWHISTGLAGLVLSLARFETFGSKSVRFMNLNSIDE